MESVEDQASSGDHLLLGGSLLEPVKRVAATSSAHLDGIIEAVALDATNAASESIKPHLHREDGPMSYRLLRRTPP